MKRIRISRQVLIIIFISTVLSVLAYAQNTPLSDDVGAQAERVKSDLERKKEEFAPQKPKSVDIEIQKEAELPTREGLSFILKYVELTGMTVFTQDDFYSAYQPYLNKEVSFKDLEFIVSKIKAKYINAGYHTTIVYFPEQDIKEGKIEIRVIEGKMGELNIEGNKWFSYAFMRKYFHTRKDALLNLRSLQKDILRLNKNSDLSIKVVISAGKEPETSDVTLKVKDVFPHHIGASVDNQGTRVVGKFREALILRSTNISDRGDSLYLSHINSTHSIGQALSYLLPVDTYGTKAGVDFTFFQSQLGKEYKSLDQVGKTEIVTPYIIKELWLSEKNEADLKFGIEIKNIKKETGTSLTTSEQLRLPFLGFNFTRNDAWGQATFSPQFNFSLKDTLGASSANRPTSSRAGSGGAFFKYEHSIKRLQKMPFSSYASINSDLQLASHTLPSSEQFQLGGANSIRGYPEGDYLADQGISLNLDWIFPLYVIPQSWRLGNSDVPLRRQIEPVIFADIGRGKLKKVISGEKKDKLLAGVGGGFRVRLFNHFYIRLEWAKRVADRVTGGSGPSTFHLVFQSEL